MRPVRVHPLLIVAMTVLIGLVASTSLAQLEQPPPPRPAAPPTPPDLGTGQDVTYLTRGPLHEAFASPYEAMPETSPVIRERPPEVVDERPPSVRPRTPDGLDLGWIPGYWTFDEEANQFCWVSGLWRVIPPEMNWVSGYWDRVRDGYVWCAGYWVRDGADQLGYLPPPPRPQSDGPDREPPSDHHFWVPGVWSFENQDYRWRDGFWAELRQDYVWTPAQYRWTPYGCLFVEGYWDFRPEDRGMLFAPARFRDVTQTRIVYEPGVVVNLPAVMAHLWVRPQDSHYYFGDYYDSRMRGLVSLFDHSDRTYNSLAIYFQATRPDFYRSVRSWHEQCAEQPRYRPAMTYTHQQEYMSQYGLEGQGENWLRLGIQLRDVMSGNESRTVQVTETDHRRWVDVASGYRQFQSRAYTESYETSGRPQDGRHAEDDLRLRLLHPNFESHEGHRRDDYFRAFSESRLPDAPARAFDRGPGGPSGLGLSISIESEDLPQFDEVLNRLRDRVSDGKGIPPGHLKHSDRADDVWSPYLPGPPGHGPGGPPGHRAGGPPGHDDDKDREKQIRDYEKAMDKERKEAEKGNRKPKGKGKK